MIKLHFFFTAEYAENAERIKVHFYIINQYITKTMRSPSTALGTASALSAVN